MALDRTQFDLLVDENGGPGTMWNKSKIDSVILDPVDAAAAFINQSNTFVGDQTVDGDLFVTGEVNPTRRGQQLPKINQLIGDARGSRTLLSKSLVSGLSIRHDEDVGEGRLTCGNYDTQTYQPVLIDAESLQVRTAISPAERVEHLRVHPSGGVTLTDHATDPGEGVLVAKTAHFANGIATAQVHTSAARRVLGRGDTGAGPVDELTLGEGLVLVGTTLSAPGPTTGTWTPAWTGASGASGTSYTAVEGTYVKVGRLVHAFGRLVVGAVGTITGQLRLTGLPFVALNVTNPGGLQVTVSNGLGNSLVEITGSVIGNGPHVNMWKRANAGMSGTAMTSADLKAGTEIQFHVCYQAAS